MSATSNKQLQSTIKDLQQALNQWDSIPDHGSEDPMSAPVETDIRKKTKELLLKLNEQIKDLEL